MSSREVVLDAAFLVSVTLLLLLILPLILDEVQTLLLELLLKLDVADGFDNAVTEVTEVVMIGFE